MSAFAMLYTPSPPNRGAEGTDARTQVHTSSRTRNAGPGKSDCDPCFTYLGLRKNIDKTQGHAYLSLWLVEGVEILTEGGDDALVPIWVLPENILQAHGESQQGRQGRWDGQGRDQVGAGGRGCGLGGGTDLYHPRGRRMFRDNRRRPLLQEPQERGRGRVGKQEKRRGE